MKTYDPGHVYALQYYSGYPEEKLSLNDEELILTFMHRVSDRYPGNQGEPYSGTNCQEVIRALIDRCKYLNKQIQCEETEEIISHLRDCLSLFEMRAAREHGHLLLGAFNEKIEIENIPTCNQCGHIVCKHVR